MPAPATLDEFLDLIRKSGVVDEGKLAAYLDRQSEDEPLPTDPSRCAGQLIRDAILTHFQAEQLLQGKWKRFTIGKYKVLEKIGVGGMGQVFLCEHKLMRRRVAVKVLPTAKGQDDASRERFYREARAVAALDHPNIVRAFDIDNDEGLHFLVMEYVDGINLQDLVKKHMVDGKCTLDVQRVCHYIYGAAVGLQYAQEMGIIHRDIKPGNILIDRTGVVKILDMGLARFFNDEDDSLTKKYDENILGTADYLAPEQAVDSHGVDIRADLYSLGGTFYYLLTGNAPFPEGSVAQKLLWHQTRDPKPIGTIRPEVPEALIRIDEKLMKKDPAERYQSPNELLDDLKPWVQTAILPPADRELPRLSPAASGQSSNRAGGSTFPNNATSGKSPSSSEYHKTGAAEVQRPSNHHQPIATVTPAVVSTPNDGSLSDSPVGNIWSNLEHDTSPDKAEITTPAVRPKAVSKPVEPKPTLKPVAKPTIVAKLPQRRILAAVGGGILLLALLGGLYSYFSAPKPSTAGALPAELPKLFYVSRRPASALEGKTPVYKSILEVLAVLKKRTDPDESKKKEGASIVLLDAEFHEDFPLPQCDGNLSNLTIQAENKNQPVVWSLPRGSKSKSVLEIKSSIGLSLRGLILDGGGHTETGILVWGTQPGLLLEDVTVKGATKDSIRFETVSAEEANPMRLHRVRVLADNLAENGIHFTMPAGVPIANAKAHSSIRILDSRFEGAFKKAAVLLAAPLKDCEFLRNRFHGMNRAFQADNASQQPMSIQCKITNNTFHTIKEAAFYSSGVALSDKSVVAFNRNYFAQTKSISTVKNIASISGFRFQENARDEKSGDGDAKEKALAIAGYQLPDANPANDAAFLRYPRSAPLAAVGTGKYPVGMPPE